jgi:dolichol-phosphate mannosyltransferase
MTILQIYRDHTKHQEIPHLDVAIVIPTFNERSNIVKVIQQIRDAAKELNNVGVHVVVVDDNSQDGTSDAVLELASRGQNIHLIRRPKKMGLGSAYLDAFAWIVENQKGVEIIFQMDADLSHPPQLLSKMIDTIVRGSDVVVASRYSGQGGSKNWPLHRRIISRAANAFARLVLGISTSDITSGYRAYSVASVKELLARKLSGSGYEYQIEVLYILSRLHKNIVEVPFVFTNRAEGQSKLTSRDMMRFASTVLKLRSRSIESYKVKVLV